MKLSMMRREIITKRIATFFLIAMSFSLLLLSFVQKESAIRAYKPYYLTTYVYLASYKLSALSGSAVAQEQSGAASSVPVLVYHGMLSNPDNVSTSVGQFASEMFALKEAGYQTVRMSDFREYIAGRKELPEKSFLLTFDDGRKDSYYPVDPILKELDYTAVMFVITGTFSSPNNFHLTTSELQEMQNSGRWDLEAHAFRGHGTIPITAEGGQGHYYSNKMWLASENRLETDQEFQQRISSDLTQAKEQLRDQFGINAYAFAFPFNDFAQDSLNYSEAENVFDNEVKQIYRLLFYQVDTDKESPGNTYGSHAQFIKRINVETTWDADDLLSVISK